MKVKVNAHAERHPLREVVVGSAAGAQVPTVKDESLHGICCGHMSDEQFAAVRAGPFPRHVIEETNEDLERFAEDLTKMGLRVHRPAPADFTETYQRPDWKVGGYYAYCPRDTLLTVGRRGSP